MSSYITQFDKYACSDYLIKNGQRFKGNSKTIQTKTRVVLADNNGKKVTNNIEMSNKMAVIKFPLVLVIEGPFQPQQEH